MKEDTVSIFVAIVGRPNVGKSSLLNRLVGEKVAIVTHKPQTTRTRITGIVTKGSAQYVFLDTPGMHRPRTLLGQRMTRTVRDSLADGDAVLMLFEPKAPLNDTERELVEALRKGGAPALALVNKADCATPEELKAKRQELEALDAFEGVHALSALTGEGCDELFGLLLPHAVPGPHFFSDDAYTDLPEKQLVAELVREKLLLYMEEEIPHGIVVEVECFEERGDKPIVDIDIIIYCEKKSHKGMVIGKGGEMLKKIASAARADCEEMLDSRVNMQCWVKVKDDWRNSEYLLKNFGFPK